MPRDKKRRRDREGEAEGKRSRAVAEDGAAHVAPAMETAGGFFFDVNGQETAADPQGGETKPPARPEAEAAYFSSRWADQAYFGKLSEEQLSYMKNLEAILSEERTEVNAQFVENVFREMRGNEMVFAGDYDSSRIIERVLYHAEDAAVVLEFWGRFAGQFVDVCTHRFASHVMQTLIHKAPQFFADADGEAQTVDMCIAIIKELSPHMLHVLRDPYGTHIVRSLAQLSAGNWGGGDADKGKRRSGMRSHKSEVYSKLKGFEAAQAGPDAWECPAPLRAAVENHIAKPLIAGDSGPLIAQLIFDPLTAPLVSVLLVDHAQIRESVLIRADEAWNRRVCTDKVASHVAQRVFEMWSEEEANAFFTPEFVVAMAQDAIGNFPAQTLISRLNKENFVLLLGSLEVGTGLPLGVLHAVADGCVRHNTGFARLVDPLWKALGCETGKVEEIPYLLPSLLCGRRTLASAADFAPSVAGFILAAKIARFPGVFSRPVTISLLRQPLEVLEKFALDSPGSRFLEALIGSPTTNGHHLRDLAERLAGSARAADLCANKNASHVVEALFFRGDLEIREKLCKRLAPSAARLQTGTPYGRKLCAKLGLAMFLGKWKEWREQFGLKRSGKRSDETGTGGERKDMAWLTTKKAEDGGPAKMKKKKKKVDA